MKYRFVKNIQHFYTHLKNEQLMKKRIITKIKTKLENNNLVVIDGL